MALGMSEPTILHERRSGSRRGRYVVGSALPAEVSSPLGYRDRCRVRGNRDGTGWRRRSAGTGGEIAHAWRARSWPDHPRVVDATTRARAGETPV